MEIRKLTYNGTSTLLALPPAFMSAAKLKAGDHVIVELKRDFTISIRKLPESAAHLRTAITKGDAI